MPDPFSLAGKVVVQFGGSGLLGRSLVRALCDAGATTVVASRNREVLSAAVAPERAAHPTLAIEEVDIAQEASLLGLRDRLLTQHGRVDGVVFNAVARVMKGYADKLSSWETSMSVNASGFFSTMRVFGDVMAAQKRGSIVNIASTMGMVGMNPHLYASASGRPSPDYFFHKGGMINLTRYLASQYGESSVRVNVVSPGGIYNPEKPQPAEFLARYAPLTMLGRMADAREIGGAVVFLLSDASTYITGTNLPVDGGYTAK